MTSNVFQMPLPDSTEARRMAAVRRYDILDTPPDGSFDRITALAARMLGTPIAIVSIVDTDRIWFKSHHGLDVEQIPRDMGLCASAIMQHGPWLVSDTQHDPRTMTNPLVAGEFGLGFYVGVPLQTYDGFNLGTLCVLDFHPRIITQDLIDHLNDLASIVMDQLELRLSARSAITDLTVAVEQKDAAYRQAELMAKEIDHRVRNSLQLIASMLAVQSLQLRGTVAADEIAKAAGKIVAVAQVHQHMHLDESITTMDCADYLRRLCDVLSVMFDGGDAASIDVDAISISLPSAEIGRIGLIVNELVTNALKYGATSVKIQLSQSSETGQYCLSVADNGAGLPADFTPEAMPGLGMRVIASLVRNLDGVLSYASDEELGGTRFMVSFPVSGAV